MKKKEKQLRPILKVFTPRTIIFNFGGGSAPQCGSVFFKRYQFEILTQSSLCKNKSLKKKKSKFEKKKGLRAVTADLMS